jgi:cell cycle sensor histidine kinase DivJ
MISLAVRWGPRGEQEQPQAEAASGTLPETSFDAVVARMTRGAEVETVSPQAARLLEIEPDLLLAMGLFERMHIADRVTFLRDISLVRQDGVARSCELRIRLPKTAACGGGYRLFLVELLRASDKDDAIVAVIRDGRHIAAMREELAQARAMADATEVAKGRFLAAVSHELRTPLNAIIGFSDMLLHPEISGELSARQSEHVTLIREAGNHLLSVVNAILDVSKIEAGAYPITVDPFEPEPMIELCRAMMTPQAMAKGVSLTSSTPRGLGELVADQRAFQQILLNLVSNAIKFTPEGGSVGISALREGETMRIVVSDNGIGISEEDLEKLGRPFMQVQNDYTRQFQGTGLGLSLVKGLVKLHGGMMSIESAPGLGTTVAIALPAMEGSGKRPAGPDDKTDEATAVEENYGIALRKIA